MTETNYKIRDSEELVKIELAHKHNSGHVFTAYDFLHGYCQYFALALAEKYSFKIIIWEELDEDINKNCLVHAFNVIENNGVKYYIDVRGIAVSSNIDAFVEDFPYSVEPNFDYMELTMEESKTVLDRLRVGGYKNKFLRKLTNDFIESYPDYYKV